MGREINKRIAALRLPLLVLGFLVSSIYRALFGRADRTLAVKNQEELAHAVRQRLAFLFVEHQGEIVPNVGVRFPPGFDYAYITVSVGNLLFRFLQGRGELTAEISRNRLPNEWHDLSLVLSLIDPLERLQRVPFPDLTQLAQSLQSYIDLLETAFSDDEYPRTQKQLSGVYAHDLVIARQWETELNRRLYPDS